MCDLIQMELTWKGTVDKTRLRPDLLHIHVHAHVQVGTVPQTPLKHRMSSGTLGDFARISYISYYICTALYKLRSGRIYFSPNRHALLLFSIKICTHLAPIMFYLDYDWLLNEIACKSWQKPTFLKKRRHILCDFVSPLFSANQLSRHFLAPN